MSAADNTSYTVRSTSTATNLTANDYVLLCTPTASFVVGLPDPLTIQPGRPYVIRQSNVAGNQVTLDSAGSALIDGAATIAVGAVATIASVRVVSDGTNWFTIA